MNKTFIFNDEDHTLGNLLHQELLLMEEVTYAAYLIEHPLKKVMKLEIHSDFDDPKDLLNKALHNIINKLDIIENEFINKFKDQDQDH